MTVRICMPRHKRKGTFVQISEKQIYQARMFDLKAVKMRAPDGHEFQHEIIFHPGAAVVIPHLGSDQFVLIRQYRTAVRKVIWEFPAGTLERGEAPLACAKREIVEETGFEAGKWQKLGLLYPAPGISTELMHIFLASELKPSKMSLDRDEFIQRKIVSFSRLQKMILSGRITDGKTIAGFFYYSQKCKKGFRLRF
ncbi:MAG: NUDIX hydrolase [Candidatus Omnitrophica bacterium]|nr:NUDIX hydrolase [Candidatus Omnitrophota bacterium]